MVKELIKTACQTLLPRPQRLRYLVVPQMIAGIVAAILAVIAEAQQLGAAGSWADFLANVPVKDVATDVARQRDDFVEWWDLCCPEVEEPMTVALDILVFSAVAIT